MSTLDDALDAYQGTANMDPAVRDEWVIEHPRLAEALLDKYLSHLETEGITDTNE